VDDLLDVARIEQGKLALHRERLDLVSLIREVLEPERAPLRAANLDLEVKLSDKPLWVDADPTRLAQVFSNLLSNARKFTPSAGTIRVRVEADAQDHFAKVVVADTGCGIDPQQLPGIFAAFQQSHAASQHKIQGLGLGLAIAKGLVEAHDGRLEACSGGQDQGTEFTVSLPKQTAPVKRSEMPQTTTDAGACRRILVVDDHQDSAKGLSELLTLYGHEVEVVFDGPAALKAAVRFYPDIVICDIGLPDMDGYQIAQALQRHSQTAEILLFALTGYGDDETVRRVRAAGFAYHLTKPVNPAELKELLVSVSASKIYTE
jgi:two-component system CheB/CheR fusion protein